MNADSGLIPFARFAVLALASSGAAMTYEPFPLCTDQAQVDSVRTRVYFDESLDPGRAPYTGSMISVYHPGTCFLKQTVQKPYYLDTVLTLGFALSADRRRLDMEWKNGGDPDSLPWGSYWYDEQGMLDSSQINAYRRGSEGTRLGSRKETRLRTPRYQTIKTYYRLGEEPWGLYDSDSIVAEGEGVVVHSMEDGERYVTRCAPEGMTYACKASPEGEVTFPLEDKVWYLTGGRIDSLRIYDDQGRLRSTNVFFWSPRTGAAIRRPLPAGRRPFANPPRGKVNALGRILPSFPAGSRAHSAYFRREP